MSHTELDDDWDDYSDLYDDDYEEPPLYKPGFIAGLSNDELVAEARRQCRIHDSAVDRCEEINSPTIETAQFRLDVCEAECKKRGLDWGEGMGEEEALPYKIDLETPNCDKCHKGALYTVVGPDGVTVGASWEDRYEAYEHAIALKSAYELGLASVGKPGEPK